MLKENERKDSLEYKGLSIIQSTELYRFTSDAVLLANAVRAGVRDHVIDLGSGSGIISILIAAKRGAHVTGIELQEPLWDMSKRSVEMNGMTDAVELLCGRIQDAPKLLGNESFDIVVSNPPYGKKADAAGIPNGSSAIARTELFVSLREVVEAAAKLLRYGGRFYTVIKTLRLAELIELMGEYGVEPKELTLVLPTAEKAPDTAIVCGKKGGKTGLKVELKVENGKLKVEK
ncbi:MAG: methyltransferase [Clostridiales bacterium]|jgi:tRNA1Val (adenine37-N6)-methyltransferase|nr:methyltransferase [Clostridiales bacterium]